MSRNTAPGFYSGVKCDKCGGDTFLMPTGSIWCSAEDPHPGGHFVKRVAFERPPTREPRTMPLNALPQRQTREPVERRASAPTSKPVKKVVNDGFDTGFDGFVKGDD